MPYKNWPEICTIQDDELKFLVATTESEEVILGLAQGFPTLFSEVEIPARVPASVLDRISCERELKRNRCLDRDYLEKQNYRWEDWYQIIQFAGFEDEDGYIYDFDIPILFIWDFEDSHTVTEVRERIAILGQIIGQSWSKDKCLEVEYGGVSCILLPFCQNFENPVTEEEAMKFDTFILVSADSIDLTA